MSYLAYKVIHIFGVLLVFTALGGLILRTAAGSQDESSRKLAGMTHGIALLVVLISGFGLIAQLGTGFPMWVVLKVCIWLLLGAMVALIRKQPHLARFFWLVVPLLGLAAAYLALFKPGA